MEGDRKNKSRTISKILAMGVGARVQIFHERRFFIFEGSVLSRRSRVTASPSQELGAPAVW